MDENKVIIDLSEKVFAKFDEQLKRYAEQPNYDLLTLSSGLPGLILLSSELTSLTSERKYSARTGKYVNFMVKQMRNYGVLSDSLFSGVSGIGISILHLVEEHPEYHNLLISFNEYIKYYTLSKIENIDIKKISPTDYDIIEGVSGVLVYLLSQEQDENDYIINRIINFLSEFSLKNSTLTGFYVESKNQMSKTESKLYPLGCLNFGLAHGLAGVGAMLSYSKLKGYSNEKSIAAIKKIIMLYELQYEFIRDAWCYGSPGISLLYLYSSLALEDKKLKSKACNILKASIRRSNGLEQSILCHGFSGAIEICLFFKKIYKTTDFDDCIKSLKEKLISDFREDMTYGFNTTAEFENIKTKDNLGYLDGIIGILLTMIELNNLKVTTNWQRALLLFDDVIKEVK
ncbi:TPA: lanthionine synthetase C family protein [Streptococcus agalactiae]